MGRGGEEVSITCPGWKGMHNERIKEKEGVYWGVNDLFLIYLCLGLEKNSLDDS